MRKDFGLVLFCLRPRSASGTGFLQRVQQRRTEDNLAGLVLILLALTAVA